MRVNDEPKPSLFAFGARGASGVHECSSAKLSLWAHSLGQVAGNVSCAHYTSATVYCFVRDDPARFTFDIDAAGERTTFTVTISAVVVSKPSDEREAGEASTATAEGDMDEA